MTTSRRYLYVRRSVAVEDVEVSRLESEVEDTYFVLRSRASCCVHVIFTVHVVSRILAGAIEVFVIFDVFLWL